MGCRVEPEETAPKPGALSHPAETMLDAYIIEKIKREQERRDERPVLRIDDRPKRPEAPPRPSWSDEDRDRPSDRGVVIIEF